MRVVVIFLFIATITATSVAFPECDHIRLLRPRPSAGRQIDGQHDCLSWHLAAETNNLIDWGVPTECLTYVRNYMLGAQYRKDSAVVADAAFTYAKTLSLTGDGKDIWVFDVDETVLSHVPFFARYGFGEEEFNLTALNEWFESAKAPALPESLKLYNNLLGLGIKVAFLTGRAETMRNVVALNLQQQGYTTWEKLILKDGTHENTIAYKSGERAKLVEAGYRIVGNTGDQWTDLLGAPTGERTFKVPNPMYYVP